MGETERWKHSACDEARDGQECMSMDYLAGIPHGVMIGKVHELVDKIWLIQVACQRAELFISGQAMAARNNGRRDAGLDREAKQN